MVWFLAPPCESSFPGSLAEPGEQRQPQARRGADDTVVCAAHRAAETCAAGTQEGRAMQPKLLCPCQRSKISARERLPVPATNHVFGTRVVCVRTYAAARCY